MKKALILIILIFSVFLVSLSATTFKGNLPYMNRLERYEDPLYPSSELTLFIYTVFSTPYSLPWLEEYVDEEMLSTFLLYHQQDISLLTQTPLIGIIIIPKESYSIVKIDFENNERIETMWRKNEDNLYVMFSFKTKI